MLNACGQFVGKIVPLRYLTQDGAVKHRRKPVFSGFFEGRFSWVLMAKKKKEARCLHNLETGQKRWNVQNRLGQGVFNNFHRVFHIFGGKSPAHYVNVWKI